VEEIDIEFGEGQKGRELESECIFYRASHEVIFSEALFLRSRVHCPLQGNPSLPLLMGARSSFLQLTYCDGTLRKTWNSFEIRKELVQFSAPFIEPLRVARESLQSLLKAGSDQRQGSVARCCQCFLNAGSLPAT
jgi:hypothetical protein